MIFKSKMILPMLLAATTSLVVVEVSVVDAEPAAGEPASAAAAASDPNERYITYSDDDFYLQNMAIDYRWLAGNNIAVALNRREDNNAGRPDSFLWSARSIPAGGRSDDPKAGQCVKYGDVFYLRMLEDAERFSLTGSRSTGNQNVHAYAYEPSNDSTYRWVIRSNEGNGLIGDTTSDPAHGSCIHQNAVVYLQNIAMENRFLTGARSTQNQQVLTRNPSISSENGKDKSYKWIISTKLSSGSRSDALECGPFSSSASGAWSMIGNGGGTVEISMGYTFTDENSFEVSNQWRKSITQETTVGFEFKGINAGSSVSVTNEYSRSVVQGMSKSFEQSYAVTQSRDFPAGGVVWQWVSSIQDVCDHDIDVYAGTFLLQTKNALEYPCCLPGFFEDNVNKPLGPCIGGPNLCESSLINNGNSTAYWDPDFDVDGLAAALTSLSDEGRRTLQVDQATSLRGSRIKFDKETV